MKYENVLQDYITLEDIANCDWSSHIEKIGTYYILHLENQFESKSEQAFNDECAENLATFCRGYLLALEYVKTQEDKNVW